MATVKRLLLIGANGQLGYDLGRVFREHPEDYRLTALTHADIEITNPESVKTVFEQYDPEIVLSMAAFHKVDICEVEAKQTFAVNTLGARNLALRCKARNATLVFMSTDYVFGGDQERKTPYVETDLPAPINVYGIAKLAGEYLVQYLMNRYFIFRVTGLYGIKGSSGKGGNFVENMLKLAAQGKELKIVNDQVLTPTYTVDAARQIERMLRTEHYGLYHATSQGQCSWYEFAVEIFRQAGVKPNVFPTTSEEFPTKARRPAYSVLDNAKLRGIGLDLTRPWQEALAAYLAERPAAEAT